MGDSITEGTIVEWTAAVGEGVKEGDVVAMVETDKVTIEIKAEIDGVICRHFGDIDDTIEVGGNLYEIDTDAVASGVSPSSGENPQTSENVAMEEPASITSSAVPEQTQITQHRSPSIKFLGKEGWERRRCGQGTDSSVEKENGVSSITTKIHPMYGRPLFTEGEMEALILGGANLEPESVPEVAWAKHA